MSRALRLVDSVEIGISATRIRFFLKSRTRSVRNPYTLLQFRRPVHFYLSQSRDHLSDWDPSLRSGLRKESSNHGVYFGGSHNSIRFPSGSMIQANFPYSWSSRLGSMVTPSARSASSTASMSST